MNNYSVTRRYSKILTVLLLISIAFLLVTPFLSAFHMDRGLFSTSEKGIDYFAEAIETISAENETVNALTSGKNSGTATRSNKNFIESTMKVEPDTTICVWVMVGFVLAIFVWAFFQAIKLVLSSTSKRQEILIFKLCKKLGLAFALNLLYYLFCMFFIMKTCDWDFEYVLGGDFPIRTETYLPVLAQLCLLLVAGIVFHRWKKAVQWTKKDAENLLSRKSPKKKKTKKSNGDDSEEDTFLCQECGYPLMSDQEVCPHCGTRWVEAFAPNKLGEMKWHKFLVYFALIVVGVLNVGISVLYFTGFVYGENKWNIYSSFPEMRILDIVFGVGYVISGIACFITAKKLSKFRTTGPGWLYAVYIIQILLNGLYAAGASTITGQAIQQTVWILIVFQIVVLFANAIYFYRRKDLFIY